MSKPTAPRPRHDDGELGDLERAVGVAHRGDELADADVAAALLGGLLALLDARLHGLDDLFEREAARQVLLGRPAHLAVDHAVGGEVLDELARDPGEALARSASRRW